MLVVGGVGDGADGAVGGRRPGQVLRGHGRGPGGDGLLHAGRGGIQARPPVQARPLSQDVSLVSSELGPSVLKPYLQEKKICLSACLPHTRNIHQGVHLLEILSLVFVYVNFTFCFVFIVFFLCLLCLLLIISYN